MLVYSIFPKTESTLFSSRNNGLWRSKSIPRRVCAGKVFIKQSYCRLLVIQNMRFCSTTCRNLGENLLSKQNLNRVQSRFLPECCRNDHRARKESVTRSRSPRARGTLRAQSLRRGNATVDAMFSFAADLSRLRRSIVPNLA